MEKFEKLQKVREEIESKFKLNNDILRDIMVKFEREIKKGLSKATHKEAEIKCFVTYVRKFPKGTETGKFLALDLGGTNFRVLYINLLENQEFEQISKSYGIPQFLMVGHGEDLFDYIAKCLAEFAKELNLQDEILPLGFTFSFPVSQQGLTQGFLVRWTKGFQCEGVVEQNVVELLEKAIEKRHVKLLFYFSPNILRLYISFLYFIQGFKNTCLCNFK
jgi:hexokinase